MHPGSYYRSLVLRHLGIEVRPGWTLDMGAGDGQITMSIGGAHTVALDPSPPTIPGGNPVRGDGRMAPFLTGCFSTLLAFDVLEHVHDDDALMRELLRVAAPGATIWLSVPAREMVIFPAFLTGAAHRAWGHVRPGYTRSQLELLLRSHFDWSVLEWNEPAYRSCYLPLRIIAAVAPPLARLLLRVIAAYDGRHRKGGRGHYFCLIRMDTSSSGSGSG